MSRRGGGKSMTDLSSGLLDVDEESQLDGGGASSASDGGGGAAGSASDGGTLTPPGILTPGGTPGTVSPGGTIKRRVRFNETQTALDGRATVMQTAANMLNVLEGTGLLALPYTVRLAGWSAVGLILFVGLVSTLSAHLLVRCLYDRVRGAKRHRRVRDSYMAVGQAAYGEAGRIAVVVVQLASLLGFAALLLVLVGTTMADLAPTLATDEHMKNAPWLASKRAWTGIAWVTVVPMSFLPSLKQVSALSVVAVLCLLVAVWSILVTTIQTDRSEWHTPCPAGARAADGRCPDAVDALAAIPCVFSILVFSFTCHGQLPAMEASMLPPVRKHFGKVVAGSFLAASGLKAVFALAGFACFGPHTDAVVITDLPHGAVKYTAEVAVMINTLLTVPQPIMVAKRVIAFIRPMDPMAARAIVLSLVGVLAVTVPDFAKIMQYVGSVVCCFTTFVFPALFYWKLRGTKNLSFAMLFALCLLLILGIGGSLTAIYFNFFVPANKRC